MADPARLSRVWRLLRQWWRVVLRALLLVAPTLALIPLGVLWLRDRGIAFEYVAVGAVAALLAIAATRLWRPDLPEVPARPSPPGASPGEREARARLATLASSVGPGDIGSAEAARRLAERAVREVASAFHPGAADPVLRVTLPELLLVVERTSRDMRRQLLAEVPVLRDLRIELVAGGMTYSASAQAWFNAATYAYRTGRFLMNPVIALASEAQRLVLGAVTIGLGDLARIRIGQILVRETGEAAIRLYSGSCRLDAAEEAAAAARDAAAAAPAPPPLTTPLRVTVVGQLNAGKSSLVNALAGEVRSPAEAGLHTPKAFHARVDDPALGLLILTDTPGFAAGGEPEIGHLLTADLVVWAVALHRADRGADLAALAALRRWSAAHPARPLPPLVFAPTHADRLDPPGEWRPPYDVESGKRPKEKSIRRAVEALREALAWPEAACVPVVVAADREAWNLAALRAALLAARPAAEAVRAARLRERRSKVAMAADAARSVRGMVARVASELTRGTRAGRRTGEE